MRDQHGDFILMTVPSYAGSGGKECMPEEELDFTVGMNNMIVAWCRILCKAHANLDLVD